MEKANRVRKIVTRTAAGVLFVTLLIFNLQIGVFGSGNSQLSLSTLAFGMFTPAAGEGGCKPPFRCGGGGGCGGPVYTCVEFPHECNGKEILAGECNTITTCNGCCGLAIAKGGSGSGSCQYSN